jgi:DNA polymerase-3 subunit delta
MKLDARGFDRVLRDSAQLRVVLLHGPDEGLVRTSAARLAASVAPASDPFRAVSLGRDDHARLTEEAMALSMVGGRRVVRLDGAGDTLTAAVQALVERSAPALVVLEAGALAAKSKLRQYCEATSACASVAFYHEEGAALEAVIRGELSAAGIRLSAEALAALTQRLGSDWVASRSELEKIRLLAPQGDELDAPAVLALVGDQGIGSVEEPISAALLGDVGRLDHALSLAQADGTNAVQLVRMALQLVHRALRVRLAMDAGAPFEAAAREIRPPLFRKQLAEQSMIARRWTSRQLLDAARRLAVAERECKSSGVPDFTVARQCLLGIAWAGAQRRR